MRAARDATPGTATAVATSPRRPRRYLPRATQSPPARLESRQAAPVLHRIDQHRSPASLLAASERANRDPPQDAIKVMSGRSRKGRTCYTPILPFVGQREEILLIARREFRKRERDARVDPGDQEQESRTGCAGAQLKGCSDASRNTKYRLPWWKRRPN